MTGTVQGKQHAFDFVGLDGVIREPRHVVCEQIGLGLNVGDMMLRHEPPDVGGGGVLGHCFRTLGQGSFLSMEYGIPVFQNPCKPGGVGRKY
jgi:hypothetical protein